jgi:hypothetical protein
MVILQDENHFDVDSLLKEYNSNYENNIEDLSGDNSSIAFTIDGEMVGIGHMPFPIPHSDIEETSRYAYNWQSVLEDIKDHKSHLIVSIMQGGQDQIKRFKIFTQVLSSLLRTTNSLGIYQGTQSLLIPKSDYLEQAALMSNDYLPLYLWIYFGLRRTKDGNSGYTYGLKEFNKTELEILNSSRSLEEIRNFLFDIAHYILDYDVTFREGQTCGASEDERVPISFSKGEFVKGDSFKLAY